MQDIQINDYNYELPEERIAKFPLSERDQSKLLVYKKEEPICSETFKNIVNYINPDQLLVLNNSKVIFARLIFEKPSGSQIEIFCLKPYQPSEYQLAFQAKNKCIWICLIGNLRKWKNETLTMYTGQVEIQAKKIKPLENDFLVEFTWNQNLTFSELITRIGKVPIPPYLKRGSHEIDKQRYQTIYSKYEGSVAAPTAGLHFTDSVLEQIRKKKIQILELTLHVSAGTFIPVKTESANQHHMHEETFLINKKLLESLYDNDKQIVSAGTTTLRALESIYWLGVNIEKKNELKVAQWDAYYEANVSDQKKSIENLLLYFDKKNINQAMAETSLIIIPGYRFKMVSGLITNFHQPKSTLLLLVAAFMGNDWKKIYQYALQNNFRFLSYGDSSLILPNK